MGVGLCDFFYMNFCFIYSFVLDCLRIDFVDFFFEVLFMKFEDYDFFFCVCVKYMLSFVEINCIVGDYYFKDDGSNIVFIFVMINV